MTDPAPRLCADCGQPTRRRHNARRCAACAQVRTRERNRHRSQEWRQRNGDRQRAYQRARRQTAQGVYPLPARARRWTAGSQGAVCLLDAAGRVLATLAAGETLGAALGHWPDVCYVVRWQAVSAGPRGVQIYAVPPAKTQHETQGVRDG